MAWKEDHECIGKVLCGVCWVKAGRKSSNPMVKFLGMEVNPIYHYVVLGLTMAISGVYLAVGYFESLPALMYLSFGFGGFVLGNHWLHRHYRRWWREQRKGGGLNVDA